MVRKASTRKRQTEVAGKKKLVAGVDFAPPDPISSVLPQIELTSSQADELWALVCKGRNPDNDEAAMGKEIFAYANLSNAVQSALQFYVRDVMFLSDVPQSVAALRRSKTTLPGFSLPCRRNMIRLVIFSGGRTPARYF